MSIIKNAEELTFRADLLREEIRRSELSQHKIAKAMGLSPKTISGKMNGKYDWTLKEIQMLQNILNDFDVCIVFGLEKGEK